MNLFLLNLLLALAWSALIGSFEPVNLLFGFGLGYLVLGITERSLSSRGGRYFEKSILLLQLAGFFFFDLLKANFRLLIIILSKRLSLKPAVISIPLDLRNNDSITLLSNLITLTPGTLSLDISSDKRLLFLHVLFLEDREKFTSEIKNGYEKRIKELME